MSWGAVIIGGAALAGGIASAAMAPDSPDPYETSDAQANANNSTARLETTLNRYDQSTPWGNLNWTQDEENKDKWSSTTTLNPMDQQILDANRQTSLGLAGATQNSLDQVNSTFQNSIQQPGGATPNLQGSRDYYANALTDPSSLVQPSMDSASQANSAFQGAVGKAASTNAQDFNYNSAPDMPTASDQTRQSVEDALYGRATSRLDPMYEQRQAALDSQLANQGITQGSKAYGTEQQNLGMERTDAYQTAMNEAILAGGQEQSRQFDLGMQSRQQGVSEIDAMRNQVFNEATAMGGMNTAANQAANQNLGLQNAYQSSVLNLGNSANQAEWGDRTSMLEEQYGGRNQVLNELNALRSGMQVQAPEFQATQTGAQVAPVDVAGNVYNSYQADVNKANTIAGGINSGLSGIGQAGAAYMLR